MSKVNRSEIGCDTCRLKPARPSLQIRTHLLPPPIAGTSIEDGVAVVIDVLRATSVLTTAVANGASSVTTFSEIEPTRRWAQKLVAQGHSPWLGGERGCRLIPGFDAANSPGEYGPIVAKRPVLMTTTNGTRAIASASRASRMYIASFLNLAAVVERLSRESLLHIVCSGTEGQVTGEDVLLAGSIVQCLRSKGISIESCDASSIALATWMDFVGTDMGPQLLEVDFDTTPLSLRLADRLAQTLGGRNLVRVGFTDDLARCSAINSIKIIPQRMDAERPGFAEKNNECEGTEFRLSLSPDWSI
jgi:2-phosphosulfolactate phosphatase